jgi:hypothetical protein
LLKIYKAPLRRREGYTGTLLPLRICVCLSVRKYIFTVSSATNCCRCLEFLHTLFWHDIRWESFLYESGINFMFICASVCRVYNKFLSQFVLYHENVYSHKNGKLQYYLWALAHRLLVLKFKYNFLLVHNVNKNMTRALHPFGFECSSSNQIVRFLLECNNDFFSFVCTDFYFAIFPRYMYSAYHYLHHALQIIVHVFTKTSLICFLHVSQMKYKA